MSRPLSAIANSEFKETMKNFSSTDQHYYLWVLLAQKGDAIFKVRQKELDQHNITAKQAAGLFVIQVLVTRQHLLRYHSGFFGRVSRFLSG